MADKLKDKECVPCKVGAPTLERDETEEFLKDVNDEWKVTDNTFIERTFKFKNFKNALEFTNRVGEVAEAEGHHPDIFLTWGKVKTKLMTHKIDGLHENDFIMASKIDNINRDDLE